MSKKSCDRDHHTIFISREDRRSLRDREKTIADPDRDQKIGDQSCLDDSQPSGERPHFA